VDRRGRPITNAEVRVIPQNVEGPIRSQRTYLYDGVKGDDIWRDNFVVGDLPAGRYRVEIHFAGVEYRNFVEVLPGRTNFLTIGTTFEFFPTATPTPTITAPITGTTGITTTIPITITPELHPEGEP